MGFVVRRIRGLCAQALAARGADEVQQILLELRQAVHEHDEVQQILSQLKQALRVHNDELKLLLADYPFLLADLVKPAA
jgi:hypothetical protein